MRMLYSTALYLLLPALLLRLLWRSRKVVDYRRRIHERFGFAPKFSTAGSAHNLPQKPVIWVHAVSVGEVVAAALLIEKLLEKHPHHCVLVTTSTPAGSHRVRQLFGKRVSHAYAPWDTPDGTRRFLRCVDPHLLVLLETELWPNWIAQCTARNCAVLLANARMSQRSFAGYKRTSALSRPMFAALDKVTCQSQLDAERLLALGVSKQALTITKGLKYEGEIAPALRRRGQQLRSALAAEGRQILLAASTHPAEEPAVFGAFHKLCEAEPNSLLVLAPRQPERFDAVYAACLQERAPVSRLSKNELPEAQAAIYLCDTIGDLPALFGAADIAFIGGSLINHGGHNPVEAALWSLPILSGPHVFNFAQITQDLESAGGLQFVRDSVDLEHWVVKLSADSVLRRSMGVAAFEHVVRSRGALDITLEKIDELLKLV